MKKFIVEIIPYDKKAVTTAIESGAYAVIVEEEYTEKVKELGKIHIIAKNGDLVPNKDVFFIDINSKEDEEKAARMPENKLVVVETNDWTIIPLENLIAQRKNIIAKVKNKEEAETAVKILEKGVEGILLKTNNIQDIKDVSKILLANGEMLKLEEITITSIKPLGMGDRVCVDTSSNLSLGEGMLVGNTSSGFFLVHSETIDNPYVEKRPFRVNAGGVHAYIKMPSGKTKYLSELKTGDICLAVKYTGETQEVIVGRVKIEKRPMMLVEGEVQGKKVSLILQNAETIRLTDASGNAVSVIKLKNGDRVLGYTEESGRHFGIKIKETIEEK